MWRGMQFREFQGDMNQQGGAFICGPGKIFYQRSLLKLFQMPKLLCDIFMNSSSFVQYNIRLHLYF